MAGPGCRRTGRALLTGRELEAAEPCRPDPLSELGLNVVAEKGGGGQVFLRKQKHLAQVPVLVPGAQVVHTPAVSLGRCAVYGSPAACLARGRNAEPASCSSGLWRWLAAAERDESAAAWPGSRVQRGERFIVTPQVRRLLAVGKGNVVAVHRELTTRAPRDPTRSGTGCSGLGEGRGPLHELLVLVGGGAVRGVGGAWPGGSGSRVLQVGAVGQRGGACGLVSLVGQERGSSVVISRRLFRSPVCPVCLVAHCGLSTGVGFGACGFVCGMVTGGWRCVPGGPRPGVAARRRPVLVVRDRLHGQPTEPHRASRSGRTTNHVPPSAPGDGAAGGLAVSSRSSWGTWTSSSPGGPSGSPRRRTAGSPTHPPRTHARTRPRGSWRL